MKKLTALALALSLASCAHFQALPREKQIEVAFKTAALAAVAISLTALAVLDHDEVFGIGF